MRDTDGAVARRAEAELRESEARLRLVQQAAGIGVFDGDLRTGDAFRSLEYLALHGLPEDLPQRGQLGDDWLARVHPDDRAAAEQAFREDAAKVGAFEREYRIVLPHTGEVRWILNRGTVEADANGLPARLISAQSDITRHKSAEFALSHANEQLEQRVFQHSWELQDVQGRAADQNREQAATQAKTRVVAEQFRMLVQGVVDYALYLIGPTGDVATWNAGAQRIKGYLASEIVGQNFAVFYTPEDREAGEPERALKTALEAGRYEKEGWRVRKDGTRFVASVVIDPIYNDDGGFIGFAKITRDVTEKVAAARELEETRNALVQSQKMEMVGQLTGGLAHDFNNILAGIIGALNLMKRRVGEGRVDELSKYMDAALTSAHRAASLTSRLLAFGRRQSLDIKPVDVAAAIASMDILFGRSIGENIKLNMRLDPAIAMTDAHQLEAAILNLVVNARDAMPDGGEIAIETKRAVGDSLVSIVVSDNGDGMEMDVLAKAFDPFFTTKPIGEGTGLGLSMVHGFANQSGGDVRIMSTPGRGTIVTLLLPAASEAPAEEEVAKVVVERGAGETVLVVEDDPQVRMLVVEVLSDLGYNPLEAGNAREGLALLEANSVDLLVSDVGLPGLNGRQLAEIARAHTPGLKVLFITGYAEHARVRSTFLEAGMEMMTKPFELEVLAAKIKSMMSAA